jgi:hypothetical protein
MDIDEVVGELEKMGNARTKKVLLKPGASEPFFGVKVGDLKKIVKTAKKERPLYQTGNSDAMYLAGWSAMSKI